jgi:hypothetical protein
MFFHYDYIDEVLKHLPEIQKSVAKLKIFGPGAGAIGCETYKILSLMGACDKR